MERLTILGSAFAVANQHQENTYLLIQTEKHQVLIDCGNNPVGKLQQAGVELNEITDLILTHAHADHMGALPLLLMDMWLDKRQTPLTIFGLDVTFEKAKALLDIFGWQNWQGMFPVKFVPVSEESIATIIDDGDVKVSVGPVKHLIPTIGVRMSFHDSHKTFVYSCDTEPCPGLETLVKGADLLIQEAAGPATGHTSPEQAGKIAAKAGVKQLVLIHYDANRPAAEQIAEAKQFFSGEVALAKDLMFFE